jgi:fibronectin-binding autotransporter adhesin
MIGLDNFSITSVLLPTLGSDATSGAATFSGGVTLESDVKLTAAGGGKVGFHGVIQNGSNGAKGILTEGNGIIEISGTNTYTGATNINTGTLLINGDQSSATGAVTVASAATLGGVGTVGGATTLAGTHAAGNGIGEQGFGNHLTYSSGSIFAWELTAATTGRGSNYDAVNVGGSLGGSGGVFRAVLTEGSFADAFWATERAWSDIFMNAAKTASLSFASIFSSIEYWEGNTNVTSSIGSYGSFSISGSTLTWQAVPEPSTALAGLLLTAGLLRRRRKA